MTRAELEALIDAGNLKACVTRSGRHARSRAREAWRRGGREAEGDRQGSSPRGLHVA